MMAITITHFYLKLCHVIISLVGASEVGNIAKRFNEYDKIFTMV